MTYQEIKNNQAINTYIHQADATLGNGLMPPLFGLIANHISIGLLPPYLLLLLTVMALSHRQTVRICGG